MSFNFVFNKDHYHFEITREKITITFKPENATKGVIFVKGVRYELQNSQVLALDILKS